MPVLERMQTVLELLEQLRGLDALKELFWTELNYDRKNVPLSLRYWPESARNALAEPPLIPGGNDNGVFDILIGNPPYGRTRNRIGMINNRDINIRLIIHVNKKSQRPYLRLFIVD